MRLVSLSQAMCDVVTGRLSARASHDDRTRSGHGVEASAGVRVRRLRDGMALRRAAFRARPRRASVMVPISRRADSAYGGLARACIICLSRHNGTAHGEVGTR